MDDFMRHKPTKLNGKATLDDADAWIRECEKIFHMIAYTEAQKPTYATFLLVSDVEYLWVGMQQQIQMRKEEVNWANFKTSFLEKYFLNNAKHDREAKFVTLQQGNMTVQAYVVIFEYLARFYSQNITKEWCCKKFERGLRHKLLKFMVPLRIREFPLLMEQAKSVEQLEMRPSRVFRSQKNITEARQQKKPYNQPQTSLQGLQCFQCG